MMVRRLTLKIQRSRTLNEDCYAKKHRCSWQSAAMLQWLFFCEYLYFISKQKPKNHNINNYFLIINEEDCRFNLSKPCWREKQAQNFVVQLLKLIDLLS